MANSIDEELNRILQEEQKKKELDRLSNGIVNASPKSRMTAFVLSLLLGCLGVDRFYLGYTGLGLLKLCTFGGFCIWWLIDCLLILFNSLRPANGAPYVEDSSNSPLNKLFK